MRTAIRAVIQRSNLKKQFDTQRSQTLAVSYTLVKRVPFIHGFDTHTKNSWPSSILSTKSIDCRSGRLRSHFIDSLNTHWRAAFRCASIRLQRNHTQTANNRPIKKRIELCAINYTVNFTLCIRCSARNSSNFY